MPHTWLRDSSDSTWGHESAQDSHQLLSMYAVSHSKNAAYTQQWVKEGLDLFLVQEKQGPD